MVFGQPSTLKRMIPEDIVDQALRVPIASEAGWDDLRPEQQWLVGMMVIEGQVGNGGFHQVYFNRCADYLPLAIAGYKAIGASVQARILKEVMEMVAADPWAGPRDIWPDPDADESPPGSGDIGDFEEEWYRHDTIEVHNLKIRYIQNHPEAFKLR